MAAKMSGPDQDMTYKYRRGQLLCSFVLVLFCSCRLFGAEQGSVSGPPRYLVFSLRHISGEQGSKFLAETKIGTVSQLPRPNTLLITASQSELLKASAILKLIDAKETFRISTICSVSEADELPSNDKIEAEVGDISIGTFSSPPDNTAKAKVIIDVHNGAVVAIAPAGVAEKIVKTIETMMGRSSEPSKSLESERALREIDDELQRTQESEENNELFNKLIDSLEKAEKVYKKAPGLRQPGREGLKAEELTAKEVRKQEVEIEKIAPAKEVSEQPVERKTEEPAEPIQPPPTEAVSEEPSQVSPYEPESLPDGEEVLELNLPEKLTISDLLGLVGEYLHLDYMYDPAKVKGEVSLKLQGTLRGPIKIKDLYPLLESVLKFKGFVMTRKGNLVIIVPRAEALDIDPDLLTEGERVQLGEVIVTRIFELNHIDTASAQNLLTGMKLGANITAIAETRTLIVTGYAYRMGRIEELLTMIDKPGRPRHFRFRQLQYTMAGTLAPKVKTLAEQLGTVSITIGAPAAAPAKPVRGKRPPPRRPAPKPTPAQPTVYLDADERTNRILMIGLGEELDVVEELIDALDVQQQDLRTLRLYDIQHVGAEEVKKKLGELGVISGGATAGVGRITAPRTPAKGAKPGAKPSPAQAATAGATELLAEEPQVVIIESTNSLLVNATAEQHIQVATIIGYVDSETLEQAIPYVIYPLENQKPSELAEILQKLIQETIKDKEGKIEKTVRKIEEDIVIVPDESTFSLIVYANKKNQEWISSLIKQLDKRRPQVLIDVTLVEVTKDDFFDLDLQFATKWPKMSTGGAMDVVGAVTGSFVGGTGEVFSSPVTGTAQGFYSDAHIQALITAMQTKNYGRVLAKPKILVNDGQPGTIRTTDITNVKIDDVIPGGPDKDDRIVSRFEAYDAGITLTITPNISEGDLLLLEVELDRTDFGETPEAGSPPDTTASNINTTVTVPNDRTIILGGMLKLNQAKGGTKVPLLGDIPIIGGLFRSTSNTVRDSKLYIFVKANILRPDETLAGLPELERISDRNRAAFERAEDEFQKYEDWPGIKPKPIDPLRVLEAE